MPMPPSLSTSIVLKTSKSDRNIYTYNISIILSRDRFEGPHASRCCEATLFSSLLV